MQGTTSHDLAAYGVAEISGAETMSITGGYGSGYGVGFWFGFVSHVLYDTEQALEASGQTLGDGA